MRERFHITIPDGDGGMALRVTRTFTGMPVRFTLVSAEKDRGTHWSRFCRGHVLAKPADDRDLLELLMRLEKPECPNVLLPIMTPAFRFVAENRDELARHFRIPPIAAVESLVIASDKRKLHDFCRARGFPVLPSVPLSSTGEPGNDGLTFPVLVKTRDAQGGQGFARVETPHELAALRLALDAREVERRFVQPLVDGYDVSLATYCEGGEIKCHTLWRTVSYPDQAYFTPDCIRFVEDDRILAIGRELLRSLAWEGICDIDLLIDRRTGEPWILEINARFFSTVPACALAGVSFTRIMCERALSREEREWPVQNPEVFCETRGLARALALPGIRAQLLRHPIRRLSLGIFLRDPGPDLYQWLTKLRRDGGWLHLAAIVFLGLQLVAILSAPFVPVRFFCWAPYDEHTHYAIEVRVDGRALTPDEIGRRYHYPQAAWEVRDIDNVISIVRQYEQTYGAGDGARVSLTYRTNGHEQRTWTWPR
jgi:predicted ATP-grasp superfamily ATP-dependent carboligase